MKSIEEEFGEYGGMIITKSNVYELSDYSRHAVIVSDNMRLEYHSLRRIRDSIRKGYT